MKGRLLLFLMMLFAFSLLLIPGTFEQPQAAKGCCKQYRNGQYYPNGMNLRQCQDANNATDRDNLYQPSGQFWWDVNC